MPDREFHSGMHEDAVVNAEAFRNDDNPLGLDPPISREELERIEREDPRLWAEICRAVLRM